MALAAEIAGGDAFMVAAIRGDILAEMSRHGEAAESYDGPLRLEPEDHWIFHQAAIAHSRAGNDDRAADLSSKPCDTITTAATDPRRLRRSVAPGGPHRRRGPMYRKAVAAVPTIPTGAASARSRARAHGRARTRKNENRVGGSGLRPLEPDRGRVWERIFRGFPLEL